MLKRIIEGSVQHRALTIFAMLVVTAIGVFSFLRTPIEAFPDVTNLQVNVIAQAPGLAPEEVELQVTVPLERALNGIPGATLMRSESLFGLSLIWIVFDDSADGFRSRTYVMERLLEVDLPHDVSVELAPDYTPLGKILYYKIQAEHLTATDLRTLQESQIERSLRQVQGVADVIGVGGYLKEVHVELVPELVQGHGITVIDVLERLERSNRNVGGGFLQHGDQEFVIRSIGRIEDIEDIRSIVLHVDKGITVTLGDVANIYQSYTPRRGGVSADHDGEIVQGIVLMRRGENPNVLLSALRERIDQLNDGELPDGVRMEVLYDRGEMVTRTLGTVYNNLFHGAVLVIAMCWLFLRVLRGAMIVSIIIPLSLLTAFIGLYQLGLPANLISMGAIDFGIIVDGTVVLVENVQKQLRVRRPKDKAELRKVVASSVLEVARPTVFAMAIIIAAMLPIFSLESVEGRIFRPLALTYVFALVGALIASLTVVPALCAILMKPSDADVPDFRFIGWMEARYAAALGWVSRHRWVPAVSVAALLVATVFQTRTLGSEFLPELDEGDIYIFAEAPPSISLSSAAASFREVQRVLMSFPEVMHVLNEQGRPEDGTDNEGVNLTKLFVRLHPSDTWATGRDKGALVEAIRQELSQFPGISFNFSQPIKDSVEEAVSGVRGQVVLKAQGRDFDEMRDTLLAAIDALAPVEGITDLGLYRDTIVPQLRVSLDRPALARHGILIEDAQTVVSTALAGTVATSFFEEEFRVPIRVRTPLSDREDETAIGNILIPAINGMTVPLRELADIRMTYGRSTIPREQSSRYLALKYNIEGRDAGSVIEESMALVAESVTVPPGVSLEWGGEFENQQRAMARLQVVVPIALLIVLLLLVAAMRSLPLALIVLLTLPFCLGGGMFGLGLIDEALSVSAAVGFIALIGQTALLGLILLSHLVADPRTAAGTGDPSKVAQVAAEKMRALLLAALLTSLGLAPMAMSTDMGSETQRPFAIVIVFGMITTLTVTLFVMPLLYSAWTFRPRRTSGPTQAPAAAAFLLPLFVAGTIATAGTQAHAEPTALPNDETHNDETPRRVTPAQLQPSLATGGDDPQLRVVFTTFDAVMQHLDDGARAYADAHVTAAEAGRTLARAFEDPTLSYEVVGHLAGEDFVDGSQHAVLLAWEAPLRRIRAERSKVVDAEVELAHADARAERFELSQAARDAWAAVELAYARAMTFQRAIDHLREIKTIVDAGVERGVTAPFDEAMIRMRLSLLEEELRRSLDTLALNALFTARLAGEDDALFFPAVAWSPPPRDALAAMLDAAASPELRRARSEAQLRGAEAQLARKERTPTLGLEGGMQFATHLPGRAAIGGVSMRLPIFGAGRGAVRKADAEAEAARIRTRGLDRLADAEREATLRRWDALLAALERHEQEVLPRIRELERIARRSYEGGLIGFAELGDAVESRLEATMDRLDIMQELLEGYIELQRWITR